MRSPSGILLSCLVPALLSLPAAAQGADDCANATPVSGLGAFPFSTFGATDSPQQTGSCPTAYGDVWFLWTAPTTEAMNVSTCGGIFADSVLAIYPGGGCPSPGTQIGCNDDACGVQSRVDFNAVAGQSYLIQIGNFAPSTPFNGVFYIAAGGAPCGISNGPDVIVGQIVGIQNDAASNGLDSFTLGTTACNAGNAVIAWVGPTNKHPVIGETFYKYKVVDGSGRFEQIGMSWLKHGFASDTTNICCTCQFPPDNQHMGVGCSDTYSAGQSGSQATLAPRWQINAHTGDFPYPSANPSWSGTTARRCESLLSELEPSSSAVRYFAECTYTTADDALFGNGNNNASWIAINVTGGPSNYDFDTSGVTQPMQDALRAWPTLESGVVFSDVQIPSEGLFLVGSKATDLGGGIWHYEYAVHNVNSYLAAGTFSVPIPGGANVTHIGFHDITYRNGDGLNNVDQTGTDWPALQAGGAITWHCDTPAQDPNANAIRWATTYNFRFDADVPPASGSVAFGLWNVSTPVPVAAAATVPSGNGGISASCAGDGSLGPCPCSNDGQPGHGCENSGLTGGALLAASGVPSLGADTLHFTSSGELPSALSIVLQGSSAIAPADFGDGLRCAGGLLKRLYVHGAVGGSVSAPGAGEPPVSLQSALLGDVIPLGGTRIYQVYYRDPDLSFCGAPNGSTFNATHALSVSWGL
jgi:hypothetical protein